MNDKNMIGVVIDDLGDGMQCIDHPYQNANPGGICALCLQEKLGKLVSSSKTETAFPFSQSLTSSPNAPSFRSSDVAGLSVKQARSGGIGSGGRRSRLPFLPAATAKKKSSSVGNSRAGVIGTVAGGGGGGRKVVASASSTTTTSSSSASVATGSGNGAVLKKSRSVAPRPVGGFSDGVVAESPRKKSFWSFLYHSSPAPAIGSGDVDGNLKRRSTSDVKHQQYSQLVAPDSKGGCHVDADEAAESPAVPSSSASFGRKVGRSRSVGCGSRSFSGDFLERISTGFGDCTLRRVESHRESKSKIVLRLDNGGGRDDDAHHHHHHSHHRSFKCGGIFGGFGLMSSAASAYWVAAAGAEDDENESGTTISTPSAVRAGRNRGWGWALASPMRAFRPTSSAKNSCSINNGNGNGNGGGGNNVITAINSINSRGGNSIGSGNTTSRVAV